jgi:uncharacterized lipoprotein YmbA
MLSSFRASLARQKAKMLPLALVLAACSSQPSQLYVLSAAVPREGPQAVMESGSSGLVSASSRPIGTAAKGRSALLGVAVAVPEYLDRLDIIERTGANELKPNYGAQWGESLSVTAARTLTENLASLLPDEDFVMLPSRSGRLVDYQITLELSRFESSTDGESVMAGRWSIADAAGNERASGRLSHSENGLHGNYASMAAAMSRNLAVASTEIAAAAQRLPAPARR